MMWYEKEAGAMYNLKRRQRIHRIKGIISSLLYGILVMALLFIVLGMMAATIIING